MTEPVVDTTPRRADAMTLDEYHAVRNSLPPMPAPPKARPRVAAPTNIVHPVFDLDGCALSVAHVQDSATVRFSFDGATAELDLVQAKRLAVSLADALDAWRNTVTNVEHWG